MWSTRSYSQVDIGSEGYVEYLFIAIYSQINIDSKCYVEYPFIAIYS